MRINFIFCRHGYACHNALLPLYKYKLLNREKAIFLQSKITDNKTFNDELFIDPELSQIGMDASAYNGCIMSKTIRKVGFEVFGQDEFSSINMVGCSPLIRSMETAYQMTKSWSTKPDKIYVFPFLRELDERASNKYSKESQIIMDTTPSYAMKSISEQNIYLINQNLDNIIDFKYIENNLEGRSEAGDIFKFIEWFGKNIVKDIEPVEKLNVFIITHAGVLTDFVKNHISYEDALIGFDNNSGFIVSTEFMKENIEIVQYVSLNPYLPKLFFTKYNHIDFVKSDYYCPSKRCSNFCKHIEYDKNKPLKNINLKCSQMSETNLSMKKK